MDRSGSHNALLALATWVVLILFPTEVQAQQIDTVRTISIPAPEKGIIYIRTGTPGGVRIRSRHAPARAQTRTTASGIDPADLTRLESVLARQGLDLDVALARRNGETVVVLRHREGTLPLQADTPIADTLSIQEAERLLRSFGGGTEVDGMDRADVPPLARRIERSMFDTGMFRSLQVNFEFDRSDLLPTSDTTLSAVAEVLQVHPELRIEVAGHADSIGPEDYNRRLSARRAQEVRRALIARGVEPSRIEAAGYGEERPVLSNKTPTGRAMNRRVEFVLLNPGVVEPYEPEVRERPGEQLERLRESLQRGIRKGFEADESDNQ